MVLKLKPIKLYDFKATNGGKQSDREDKNDNYRGMKTRWTHKGKPVITSARDIGNIAAGFVAGYYFIPLLYTRIGFDAYQSFKSTQQTGHFVVQPEGASSTNAQSLGYALGVVKRLLK